MESNFVERDGYILDIMPTLVYEGIRPFTIEEALRLRIEEVHQGQKDLHSPLYHYITTTDAIAYSPDGSILVVRECDFLRHVHPKTVTSYQSLVISKEEFEALKARPEKNRLFTSEELSEMKLSRYNILVGAQQSIFGNVPAQLKYKEALDHRIWNWLVPNKQVLHDYAWAEFTRSIDKLGPTASCMGVDVGWYDRPPKVDNEYYLRPILILGMGDNGSAVSDRSGFGGTARFVGLKPAVQSAPAATPSPLAMPQFDISHG